MSLFTDSSKLNNVEIDCLYSNKFDTVHYVFDSNGDGILSDIKTKTKIIYPQHRLVYRFLLSLSSIESTSLVKERFEKYLKTSTITLRYLRKRVNKTKSPLRNLYKAFAYTLTIADNNLKFGKNSRILFNNKKTNKTKSGQAVSDMICKMHDRMYNDRIIIKQHMCDWDVLMSIAKKRNYKGELFVFRPKSFLMKEMDLFHYELMLSVIDRIQKNGGNFILIDTIELNGVQNEHLKAFMECYNRKSILINSKKKIKNIIVRN